MRLNRSKTEVNRDREDDYGEAEGCCIPSIEIDEGLREYPGRCDLGRTRGAALGHDPDVVEGEERSDHRDHPKHDDSRPQRRNRDVNELLQLRRTIDCRCLDECLVNLMQCRQEDDHDEAPPVPVVGEHHREQGEITVTDEVNVCHRGPPDCTEEGADPYIGAVINHEDLPSDDRRDDEGEKEQAAVEHLHPPGAYC